MAVEQRLVPAPVLGGTTYQFGIGTGIESSSFVNTSPGGTSAVRWFKMRGVDSNAATTPPTYRSWTVKDTPDYDASRFAGPYSGGSPNITGITVQAEFEV